MTSTSGRGSPRPVFLTAALVALGIGLIVLRTKSHAFVIITIAVLLSFQLLAANLKRLTGGSDGLIIPQPAWAVEIGPLPYYYIFFGLLVLTILLAAFVMNSRVGAGLVAIRNDEGKAASIGTGPYRFVEYKPDSHVKLARQGGQPHSCRVSRCHH